MGGAPRSFRLFFSSGWGGALRVGGFCRVFLEAVVAMKGAVGVLPLASGKARFP
jgi:hypothetical protein